MDKSEDITLEERPTLGKSLSWARTRRELSVQDVADELNLGKDVINAIENDEPIEGMSSTYIRGYQRAYVRFLELDEEELMGENASSPQFRGTHENLQVIDKNMSMRGSSGGTSFPVKLFMPLLLVGLAVIYWPQIKSIFSQDNTQQTTQAAIVKEETDTEVIQTVEIKPVTIEESIASVVENAKQTEVQAADNETESVTVLETLADDSDQVAVTQVNDQGSEEGLETEIEPSDAVDTVTDENEESDENDVASVDSQETQAKITFVATGESWLEIKDAEDTRLYRNTLKLDRITVSGALPLKIRTGNLQALRILSLQGEQRKVDVFDDSTTVADFLVERDQSGRLKFTKL